MTELKLLQALLVFRDAGLQVVGAQTLNAFFEVDSLRHDS